MFTLVCTCHSHIPAQMMNLCFNATFVTLFYMNQVGSCVWNSLQ